ncbi:MAG: FkbM family methyltransferase [Bacteroidales bacterium]|nr:FkbM family methyltransferase [Bacteroidales bacterium]
MKIIRKVLFKILGINNYLSLISFFYLRLIEFGFLKKSYPEIHFLKKIVKPGYYCIDIGANLGYYSYFLSKYVTQKGKVIAVEPIPLFCEILKKNVKNFNNIKILPVCLGNEEKVVSLGIPIFNGIVRHGMTHILQGNENNIVCKFNCRMVIGDKVFYDLEKLDFVKCDVEGFEYEVLIGMLNLIQKFKPIVQIEISQNNKEKLLKLFFELKYRPFRLINNELKQLNENEFFECKTDVYFIVEK